MTDVMEIVIHSDSVVENRLTAYEDKDNGVRHPDSIHSLSSLLHSHLH
jgi:hypothetical protein